MKRSLSILGLAAVTVGAAAFVASGNASNPVCTPTGVQMDLTGFKAGTVNNVPWTVKRASDGAVIASGVAPVNGAAVVNAPVGAEHGDNIPVLVTATWGPRLKDDPGTVTLSGLARCVQVPTTPTTTVPPVSPEPPGSTTTTPTGTTPVTTPKPPKPRPVRDCSWLRVHGAGRQALINAGCAWYFGPKRCIEGKRKVVTRRGGTVTVVCTVGPKVTG